MSAFDNWNLNSWCMPIFYFCHDSQGTATKRIRMKLLVPAGVRLFIKQIFCVLALLTGPFGLAIAGPTEIPLLEESGVLPKIEFFDESNKIVTLEKWSGKVVVLNIWATWCEPCRTEMPTLDRLQGKLGGERFEVVALSIDEAGLGVVKQFFEEIDVKNLGLYIDSTYKAVEQLSVLGLPATILIDINGQELGRLIGPAEWDTPEMIAFFEEIIASQF